MPKCYNILADASLPLLQELFQPPFSVTYYNHEKDIPKLIKNQNVLLCRSTLKVTESLLSGSRIAYVATASSGTDHIDFAYLNAHGIKCFDAKGSNAHAVADYVMASVAYLQQHHLLLGKRAAVIGMGAVGQGVYSRLLQVGFEIVGYDPLRAIQLPTFQSATLEDVFEAELLCVHANLHNTSPFPSKGLINSAFLKRLKKHTVIINAARGGIVDECDLLMADSSLLYCTDVYANEPDVNPDIINRATLCTPHIAGHTVEAKNQAVVQLSEALYREVGLIPIAHQMAVSSCCNQKRSRDRVAGHPDMKTILSFYDPSIETAALKRATDKKEAFFALRRAHQSRHDLNSP